MHPGSSPGQAPKHACSHELNELSGRVIGCPFTVLNTFGAGLVYENALAYEVRAAGLSAVQQYGAKVHYRDILVGEYFVDLLINGVLLVELKSIKALDDAHRMQCTNYLKATGLKLCLLLNFGKPHLEIKRVAHGL
jgi:GxxExxY protein